jgi:hypothetical protein
MMPVFLHSPTYAGNYRVRELNSKYQQSLRSKMTETWIQSDSTENRDWQPGVRRTSSSQASSADCTQSKSRRKTRDLSQHCLLSVHALPSFQPLKISRDVIGDNGVRRKIECQMESSKRSNKSKAFVHGKQYSQRRISNKTPENNWNDISPPIEKLSDYDAKTKSRQSAMKIRKRTRTAEIVAQP